MIVGQKPTITLPPHINLALTLVSVCHELQAHFLFGLNFVCEDHEAGPRAMYSGGDDAVPDWLVLAWLEAASSLYPVPHGLVLVTRSDNAVGAVSLLIDNL